MRHTKGTAAISSLLLMGGIVVELGMVGLMLSYYATQEGLGLRQMYGTTLSARSGVNNALREFQLGSTDSVEELVFENSIQSNTTSTISDSVLSATSLARGSTKQSCVTAQASYSTTDNSFSIISIQESPLSECSN